jgi:hypothetical protein
MSVKNRNTLKAEFSNGMMATEEKFENMIDSPYSRAEDSVLMGPVGITGKYGLIGPTGGTYNGLRGPAGSTHYVGMFLSTSTTAPTGPGSTGTAGEIYFQTTGTTAYAYIHNGTSWFRVTGATTW